MAETNIRSVCKIFDEIEKETSKNKKVEIIKRNKENEEFVETLKFVYDKMITTGISKTNIKKKTKWSFVYTDHTYLELLDCIKRNNTGRDVDIYNVQNIILNLADGDMALEDFLTKVITKSLKVGIDAKSINTAIPNLINVWQVQLGCGRDKLKLKPHEDFFLTQKLNGVRATYFNGKLYTRQGKEIVGFDYIINELNKMTEDRFICFDGELIRDNVDNIDDNDNFRLSISGVNSKSGDKSGFKFVVFDMFSRYEFERKTGDKVYKLRRELLKHALYKFKPEHIELVKCVYEGNDQSQIVKWLKYANENNWEGLMLNKNKFYQFKRTTDLIKIKSFYEADVRCIGLTEGEGRNIGKLGSLVVDYKGNKVDVGSGFTDKERDYYWQNPNEVLGKIVTVKYKDESRNKVNDNVSMQFPTFVAVRKDKDTESYEI